MRKLVNPTSFYFSKDKCCIYNSARARKFSEKDIDKKKGVWYNLVTVKEMRYL